MRSLLFSATVLVTVFVASGSWTAGLRRLNKAESEELNEICGKALTWQYPRRSVQRISGGTAAMQGELPWAARLIMYAGIFLFECSATIISKYHIITAAHCIIDGNIYTGVATRDIKQSFVLVGTSCAYYNSPYPETCAGNGYEQPRRVRISKIIVPESSFQHTWQSPGLFGFQEKCEPDIAIVELEDPINDMNGQMLPICVPSYLTSPPVEYTQYGFGKTGLPSENGQLFKLRQNNLQLRNYGDSGRLCKKMFAVWHSEATRQICDGDSGGGISGASREKHYLFGVLRSGNHWFCGSPHEVKNPISYYTSLIPYNDFLCFYTGVCPLGYNVYMDRSYAWHPEAALLYSAGNSFTWLNKGYFGNYKKIEAPEDYEKVHN